MAENAPDSPEQYQGALAIHHRIVALYPKVAERNALFRGLQRVSPRIPVPPSHAAGVEADRVFCALALRAAATKDSIVTLCEAGQGETAVALTRVLFENASLMAWQRLGPGRERLETYILFSSVLTRQTLENRERFYEEFGWSAESTDPASRPCHVTRDERPRLIPFGGGRKKARRRPGPGEQPLD